MSARIHPNDALFAGEKPFPIINTCEHFAGSEKLIEKAMELQQKLEGIFDITMDCEDGAKEGARFVRDHIIRVTEHAFDDFAGGENDRALNRKVLGLP